jgi:hypothetical protein
MSTTPQPDRAGLRDRIAEALLDYLSRTADIRRGDDGELAFMPEVTDPERLRIADAVLAVLPGDRRATVLREAADWFEANYPTTQMDGCQAAILLRDRADADDKLRRMVDEAPAAETCLNCRGSGLDPRYNGEYACPDCQAGDEQLDDGPSCVADEAQQPVTAVESDALHGWYAAMADEAQQPETQARPPHHRWYVETYDYLADEWAPGQRFTDRAEAAARYAAVSEMRPTWDDGTPVRRRFVRETTSFTVEQPAAVSQPGKEA